MSAKNGGAPRWSAEDRKWAFEMRERGLSCAEIAVRLSRSRESVAGFLWRNGVAPVKREWWM